MTHVSISIKLILFNYFLMQLKKNLYTHTNISITSCDSSKSLLYHMIDLILLCDLDIVVALCNLFDQITIVYYNRHDQT